MENTLQYYLIEVDRYKNLLEKSQQFSSGEKIENEDNGVNIDRLVDMPSKNDDQSEKSNNEDFFILRCFPKNCVNKCKILLQHIRNNSSIQWNSLGNIIIDQQVIEKSNVIDLLRFLLLPAKEQPSGWDHFAFALAKCNIPVSLVSNGIAKADINQHSSAIISDVNQSGQGAGEGSILSETSLSQPKEIKEENNKQINEHISQFDKNYVPPPPGYDLADFKNLDIEPEYEQEGKGRDMDKRKGLGKEEVNKSKKVKKSNVQKVIDIKGLKWIVL